MRHFLPLLTACCILIAAARAGAQTAALGGLTETDRVVTNIPPQNLSTARVYYAQQATTVTGSQSNAIASAAAHAATEHEISTYGGFRGGSDSEVTFGGAIGKAAIASDGGAVGDHASTDGGGAVGANAYSEYGGAVGVEARSAGGGAVGMGAETSDGFAGGLNARTKSGNDRIDAIQLGTGENPNEKTLQVYDHTMMNADGTIPVERMTLHDSDPTAHNEIRASISGATNALIDTYFLGTNAWMTISNTTLTVWRTIDGVATSLWSSAESAGGGGIDPAFTNAIWAALSIMAGDIEDKADKAWGQYAPDGSANPDPAFMTFLNSPATMHASGYQWATYGTYSVMAESGAVAYESGADGTARWGLDLHTNYVGFVRGGSVIVAARAGSINITGGGTTNGIAEIVYPYTSGDFPELWYAPTLNVPFVAQEGVVWVDNEDGSATVTAPATAPKGYWYATTTSSFDTLFEIMPPARLSGGVIGATNALPVVYDSTITVTSGGKNYRIPAQEVP